MARLLPIAWLAACLWPDSAGTLAFGTDEHGWQPAAAHASETLLIKRLEGAPNGLERQLFADPADGRWRRLSLLTAGLIASGVDRPEQLRRYETKFSGLVAELRRSASVVGTPRQQSQAIFKFLHHRILRGGYHLECTELTVALDDGRFNCVSASVLFNCLAGQFGLRTCGLEGKAHAMSRLSLPDETLDVETTCPDWFERQPPVVAGRIAGEGSPPPRLVSDVELIATIYYNRGVDLLAQKQFAEAVAANAKALRLDPAGTAARGNLLAGINNWAVDLGGRNRWDEAAELLRQGLSLNPGSRILQANFVHVYRQWTDALCREDRYAEASGALDAAQAVCPQESQLATVRREVYRRWNLAASEPASATPNAYGTLPSGSLPTSLPLSADAL
jgi:tetratricopeptide (TPR) repeat protein